MRSDFIKGWRTITANTLAALPVVPDLIAEFAALFIPSAREFGLLGQLPKSWLLGYIMILVVLNMFLRWKTTTPVGKKR